MQIDSMRAEITMFEAARAFAAADNRTMVTSDDLRAVVPMALRLRRSRFMTDYFNARNSEEQEIKELIDKTLSE